MYCVVVLKGSIVPFANITEHVWNWNRMKLELQICNSDYNYVQNRVLERVPRSNFAIRTPMLVFWGVRSENGTPVQVFWGVPMGGLRGVLEGSSRSEGVLERFEGAPGGPRGREGGVPDDPERTPGAKMTKHVVLYALLKGLGKPNRESHSCRAFEGGTDRQ